jgi:hypothetical protein
MFFLSPKELWCLWSGSHVHRLISMYDGIRYADGWTGRYLSRVKCDRCGCEFAVSPRLPIALPWRFFGWMFEESD